MRIYNDCMEMIREVERDLYEMGTRYQSETVQDRALKSGEGGTLELFGYSYSLTSDKRILDMAEYMQTPIDWLEQEMQERVEGLGGRPLNPGEAWQKYESFWKPFIRDGLFSYTYGERWNWQLPYVINELKRHPFSRHAMITMYSADRDIMNWGGRDRVPCSVSYQFLLREGKLHVVYNQRSCDFLKFFAADVYFTMGLQKHIAKQLGVEPGNFVHFIGSLHAFEKDLTERGIF